MGEFNKTTREAAMSCGALLVDLEPYLPKETEYMYDDVHYTVKGAEQVARKVLDAIPWEDFAHQKKNYKTE